MTFLLENLWIWFGLAALIGILGYMTFLSDRNIRTLGITVVLTLLVLCLGFSLYFFVDTDSKSVSRMLTKLASAIERDDLEAVQSFIEPNAMKTRSLARFNMSLVRVPSARFKDLHVAGSAASVPPTARVTFVAVVQWQTKGAGIEGFTIDRHLTELVKFNVELVKNDRSWLVTDNCEFTPRAGTP